MSAPDPDLAQVITDAKNEYQDAARWKRPFGIADWLGRWPAAVHPTLIEWQITQAVFERRLPNPPPVDALVDRFPPEYQDLVRSRFPATSGPPDGPPAPPAEDSPDLSGPARLADYDFDPGPHDGRLRLGQGGNGVVYRSRERALGRAVAIKFLLPLWRTTASRVDNFAREARLQSDLQLAGVPVVFATGTDEEQGPFIVMELIEGVEWGKVLGPVGDRRPVSAELGVLLKVCDAVAFAHQKGYAHRDLKPAHVILGHGDQVRIMDWGLSKFAHGPNPRTDPPTPGPADATAATAGAGTPAYMAPEQAKQEAVDDPRQTDVFQLGGMLCELLTHAPPYPHLSPRGSEIRHVIDAELQAAHSRLQKLAGEHPELVALTLNCMAVNPHDRPAGAGEVADTIRRYQDSLTEREKEARAVAVRAEADKRDAENRALLANSERQRARTKYFTALILLLSSIGGGVYLYRSWSENRRMAIDGLDRADEGLLKGRPPYDAIETALTQAGQRLSTIGCDDLRGRLNGCQDDLALLKDLDQADDLIFAVDGWRLVPRERVAAEYARVFSLHDVDPAGGAEKAAARVEGIERAAVRERVLVSLDQWLIAGRSADVLGLLRRLDRDEFRTTVREAVQRNDTAALVRLASDPAAKAKPIWFAPVIGQIHSIPEGVRRQNLERAYRNDPGNFLLIMTLGGQLPVGRRLGAHERIRWYQAAVAVRPGQTDALLNLGLAFADEQRHEDATACYREVLRLNPAHAYAHNNLGNVLNNQKRWDEAIDCYREAIRLDPEYVFAFNNLGNALKQQGDLDAAVECYRKAIALDERYFAPHDGFGDLLEMRGQRKAAIECYRKAIDLDPTRPFPHNRLGNALFREDRMDEAAVCYKQSIRLDPTYAEPHHGLGNVLKRKRDLDGAIDCFEESIRLDATHVEARISLGNALVDQGKLDRAEAVFREAIHLKSTAANAHTGLGNVFTQRGLPDKAIECYRKAIDLDASSPYPRNGMGTALLQKRDWDGAIDHFGMAICIDQQYAIAHNGLGNAFVGSGDLNGAEASYQEAIRLSPTYAAAHNGLGNALARQKDLDGAEASYKKAIDLDPKYPNPHNGLGTLWEKRGNLEEAIVCYRVALGLNRGYQLAKQNLERVLAEKAKADEAKKRPTGLEVVSKPVRGR